MTDVIKPFKIVSTREEPDGATGVTFESWKGLVLSPSKRRKVTMTAYVSVPAGGDIDMTVFTYLQSIGWL
mgnify:CR=1 FL=1